MSDKLFDLGWPVYRDGYRWVTAYKEDDQESPRELWLTERLFNGNVDATKQRYYSPFHDVPDLHRRFCKIQIRRSSIADFANTYGLLGFPFDRGFVFTVRGEVAIAARGEPYSSWNEAHRRLVHAVSLYDAILDADQRQLRRLSFIEVGGRRGRFAGSILQGRVFDHSHAERSVGHLFQGSDATYDQKSGFSDSLLRTLEPSAQDRRPVGDPVCDAWGVLQFLINSKLEELTVAKVLWDDNYEQRGIYLVPFGLWGAMWLLLAAEVSSVGEARVCEQCGARFVTKRPMQAVCCSNACRQKRYRSKRAESQKAAPDG